MQKRLKSILKIISLVITIIGGVIAIWQFIRPIYKLEGNILFLNVPIQYELSSKQNKRDILEFDLPSDRGVEQTQTTLEEILKPEYLMFALIRNYGEKTLNDVELRLGFQLSSFVHIIKEGINSRIQEKSKIIHIGEMLPHSEIVVYVWSSLPYLLFEFNTTLAHRDGIGKLKFIRL